MIDHLLALDPGHRGIAGFFVRGGAAAAARSLSLGKRTLMTTGFTVGPGQPETDGPPGAAVLRRAAAPGRRSPDPSGEHRAARPDARWRLPERPRRVRPAVERPARRALPGR